MYVKNQFILTQSGEKSHINLFPWFSLSKIVRILIIVDNNVLF